MSPLELQSKKRIEVGLGNLLFFCGERGTLLRGKYRGLGGSSSFNPASRPTLGFSRFPKLLQMPQTLATRRPRGRPPASRRSGRPLAWSATTRRIQRARPPPTGPTPPPPREGGHPERASRGGAALPRTGRALGAGPRGGGQHRARGGPSRARGGAAAWAAAAARGCCRGEPRGTSTRPTGGSSSGSWR